MVKIQCHSCAHDWEVDLPMGRRDECPKCHLDAKVCLNCRFYDKNAYHECTESQADWVEDKNRGNFCDYFIPLASGSHKTSNTSKEDAALAALFGDSANPAGNSPSKSSKLDEEFASFLKKKN